MCLAASQWARLDRVEYAATTDDAAAAGFDDRLIYQGIRGEIELKTPVVRSLIDGDEALAPFLAWDIHEHRTHY